MVKFFGIKLEKYVPKFIGWRREDFIFWGMVTVVALLLVLFATDGLLIYSHLRGDEPVGEPFSRPLDFSVSKIDDLVRKIDERQLKYDEILNK